MLKRFTNLPRLISKTSSLLFLWCWFSDHLGLDSCNINFIKPGMPQCIPPLHGGEGRVDKGKGREEGVEVKEIWGICHYTDCVSQRFGGQSVGWVSAVNERRERWMVEIVKHPGRKTWWSWAKTIKKKMNHIDASFLTQTKQGGLKHPHPRLQLGLYQII